MSVWEVECEGKKADEGNRYGMRQRLTCFDSGRLEVPAPLQPCFGKSLQRMMYA